MKNEPMLTKTALILDWIALVLLALYFIGVAPYPPITGWQGMLVFTPPIFGVPGLVCAVLALLQKRAPLNIMLVVVNVILTCWWPIFHVGGTLLFGT